MYELKYLLSLTLGCPRPPYRRKTAGREAAAVLLVRLWWWNTGKKKRATVKHHNYNLPLIRHCRIWEGTFWI